MARFDGKVALLSGAARGIGAATAKLLAGEGAHVVIGDVLEARGRETVGEIAAVGGVARFVHLDVTKEASWIEAVAATRKAFGPPDILVNNAGLFLGRDFEEVAMEDWQRLLSVNLTGVFLGTRLCAPALREAAKKSAHGSAIVNLSSIAGLVGAAADPLYGMTKGGVTIFTKSCALSFARKGDRIRVNSIHPGVIETDMAQQVFEARAVQGRVNDMAVARANATSMHPIGRLGQADDVARGIAYLASDDAAFVTGSSLVVDGGYTAQ
jgi:NAD(P)-dependent dehydrogenase (short-subunit alcohol dehydrogenase family)